MDNVYLCREQLSIGQRKLGPGLVVRCEGCLMELELISVELATAHFDGAASGGCWMRSGLILQRT